MHALRPEDIDWGATETINQTVRCWLSLPFIFCLPSQSLGARNCLWRNCSLQISNIHNRKEVAQDLRRLWNLKKKKCWWKEYKQNKTAKLYQNYFRKWQRIRQQNQLKIVSWKKGKSQRINLRDQRENKLIMLQKEVKKWA